MRALKLALLTSVALGLGPTHASAEPKVVASIKPIHSLASMVMEGIATPSLIVDRNQSPHDMALRPSQAALLEEADVIFWVDPSLESFLTKPIESIVSKASARPLLETEGLKTLPFREDFHMGEDDHEHGQDDHGDDDHGHKDEKHDDHGHDDHGHDDHGHDDHGHGEEKHAEDHDDHGHSEHEQGHEEHGHEEHGHADEKHLDHADDAHDGHNHGAIDAHIWLDPHNAEVLLANMADILAEADPANAQTYRSNAAAAAERMASLEDAIADQMKPLSERGFVVFHDAYHYFEDRFGLEVVGALTVSPETPPSAERLSEIREEIKETGAVCLFSEPQFNPRIAQVAAEGLSINTAVLDPLGADLAPGPELYPNLLSAMANSFTECLSTPK